MNRLSSEKSPYLLQHAGNPVDWYPWGEEALRRAREVDRPLFISIGYATCHWCHVMERESFEDAEVAALMNRAFVCVKVDREERPDLDEQYMTACTLLTGSGGWPLTILATPDGRPFFAATYLPRRTMVDLVPRVEEAWSRRRDEVERSAGTVLEALRQAVTESGSRGVPGAGAMERAAASLDAEFDERHGGFGGAPKFPTPHTLSFLLGHHARTGDARALDMAERTLLAMRRGGIYDHVGFGFHRYSTDDRWLVPHFEKMLYDQALLVVAYVEAYQATGRELFARTAREVLQYVERDLGLPEGAFASAEDADSEGEEGRFYVWSHEELGRVLGPSDLAVLERVSSVAPEGNGGDSGEGRGVSILHLADDGVESIPEEIRVRLAEARSRRIRPLRDDKILADWNGLAVAAFARAARVLDEPRFAAVAARAAAFVLSVMRDSKGGLLHRYRQGNAAIGGYASDYAYLAWGLLELYEATFEAAHLRSAVELADALVARFVEPAPGGGSVLCLAARDAEPLLVRPHAATDGALPSPLSVAASALLRIARMTGRADLEEAARDLLAPLARHIEEHPRAYTAALSAVDFLHGPTREVVIAGMPGDAATRELLSVVSRALLPGVVTLLLPNGEGAAEIVEVAPYLRSFVSRGGGASAYVCTNRACDLPVTDPGELDRLLRG